jgi:hypothetical protein
LCQLANHDVKVSEVELTKSRPNQFRTVIKHKSNESLLPIHNLIVKKSELKSWNICALFPLTTIASSKAKLNVGIHPPIRTLNSTYMAIDFASSTQRDLFELKLIRALDKRLAQVKDFSLGRQIARREAAHPTLGLETPSPAISKTQHRHSSPKTLTMVSSVTMTTTEHSLKSSSSTLYGLPTIPQEASCGFWGIDEWDKPNRPASSSGTVNSKIFEKGVSEG